MLLEGVKAVKISSITNTTLQRLKEKLKVALMTFFVNNNRALLLNFFEALWDGYQEGRVKSVPLRDRFESRTIKISGNYMQMQLSNSKKIPKYYLLPHARDSVKTKLELGLELGRILQGNLLHSFQKRHIVCTQIGPRIDSPFRNNQEMIFTLGK